MQDNYERGWRAHGLYVKEHYEAYSRSWMGWPLFGAGVWVVCYTIAFAVFSIMGGSDSMQWIVLSVVGMAMLVGGWKLSQWERKHQRQRIESFRRKWHPDGEDFTIRH